jgi:hypothetical protein
MITVVKSDFSDGNRFSKVPKITSSEVQENVKNQAYS